MEKGEERKVQNIRELLSMRFRLTVGRGVQTRQGKRGFLSSMFDRMRGRLSSSELEEEQSLFCLKFVEKLSEECLLVGNEFQLNGILLSCLPDYVEASSEWAIAEDDPISNLFASPKVRSLFVVCQHRLHLYAYSLESCQDPPRKQQTLSFPEPVCGVYVVKRAIVLVLLQTRFEVLEITEAFGRMKLLRRKQCEYFPEGDRPKSLEIVSIPEDQGTALQIFFRGALAKGQFPILTLRIECLSCEQVSVGVLHKFCEVPQRYISSLLISHYRSDIFLVYVGLQLYAVRNNYFLDSIITNTSKLRSFIREFNSNYFFLYHKDRFELYRYELNEKLTPERFHVHCVDTIPLIKPNGSFFLDIKQLGDHLVFLFQQPRGSESSELNFWLAVGDQVPVSAKIDRLYPSSAAEVEGAEREALEERIEMAVQMGLSVDAAYLELWERSGRVSRRDYDLLIATENYEMIAGELEAKFKKSSLRFVELVEVMRRSLAMLEARVRGAAPSPDHLRQLASCHFLLCKYRMFLRFRAASAQGAFSAAALTINIQDYYQLTRIELLKYLHELLAGLLTERHKPALLLQTRVLLTQFALIFRLKYHALLPAIVRSFRKDLLRLLRLLPELLPVEAGGRGELERGAWAEVDLRATEDYLILENYLNFENRQSLEAFAESKFFKVYQWHSHGALAEPRHVLAERLARQTPEALFILLYEQLLTLEFCASELDELVGFLEGEYALLPGHLRGRFRFYQALYESFRSFHSAMRREFMGTGEFLRLREDELFEIYFQEERAKKGIFLLKEVEPIYERTVAGGRALFLQSMFRFFQGGRSSWADLKIVLNKFNNEKEDFHRTNYEVFEVMVAAIMEKVRVGPPGQAGLDEVVSYLENIPFPLHRTTLLHSLLSIQEIRQEEATLRSLGLDMTLREILENGQEVIFRMVQAEMRRYGVWEVREAGELKLFAYKILTEVNQRKSTVYVEQHRSFPFKCFLMLLMQHDALIAPARTLLRDEFLCATFGVDDKLVENIVIYLYRKRLSLNPLYAQNKLYIDAIVNILDDSNVKRRFLELSEAYAAMFSWPQGYQMRYPFFKTYYPTVDEVAAVVAELSAEELRGVQEEEVFELIVEMKALGEDVENIVETRRNRFANHSGEEKLRVMQHELFTVFFLTHMRAGLIRECALPLARKIMAMDTRYKIYNIIVPVFLIEIAQNELIAQLAAPLARLVSYYFNDQLALQDFVEELFTNRDGFTNQQLLARFEDMRLRKQHEPIFNPANPLFSEPFRGALGGLSREEAGARFNGVVEGVWERVSRCREQFVRERAYLMLYRLLLHDPYVLAEYLNRRREGVNVRSVRALLVLLGMESLFDLGRLLELGESVFSILMVELKCKVLLEDLLQMFSKGEKYRDELRHTDAYCAELIKMEAEDLIGNSILSFRHKLTLFAALDRAALQAEKEQQFSLLLADFPAYLATHLAYPFDDRDKEYARPEEDLVLPVRHRRDQRLDFDERRERSELCEHLNYFVQPVFRKREGQLQKTLAEFYLKMNKRLPKHHHVKTNSLTEELSMPLLALANSPSFQPRNIEQPLTDHDNFLPVSASQAADLLQKSQSLKVLPEQQSEDEGAGFNFIDFLPDFKDPARGQELFEAALPAAVYKEMQRCLQEGRFDVSVVPAGANRAQLLERIVGEAYGSGYYSLLRRVQAIWEIKRGLVGRSEADAVAEAVTLRLAGCPLVSSLLARIEDIFSAAVFLEEFSWEGLLQVVRENASEAVQHQEDMLKVAEIVGVAFASAAARDSVLMMFLVRLCRAYSLTQDDREQNHIKDEIILIQQAVDPRLVAEAADSYTRARNQDLRATGHVLQYFRNYQNHLGFTHIRISAIPADL